MSHETQSLMARIRTLFLLEGVEEKHLFGGWAFLLNGHVCVGAWGASLIARLGADEAEVSLRDARVKRFAPAGRAMTGWVVVAPEAHDGEQLADWVRLAVRFVSTLPPK